MTSSLQTGAAKPVDVVPLHNGAVDLTVSRSFGPRVLRYARRGGQNAFAEVSATHQAKQTPFGEPWHIRGGHRLWAAPEHHVESYYPDNCGVSVERRGDTLHVTQQVEPHTGLEKRLSITLFGDSCHVRVRHVLTNLGAHERRLAPWALTAMAPHGTALFPHAPFVPHPEALAPARPLVLWPFTRMNDPRFDWGDRFIRLHQDSTRPAPQKFGCLDVCGYMAYALPDQLFLKCHLPRAGQHADFGCNVQTFTNELFLELETLGPLVTLAPQASVQHDEHWFLFDGFAPPDDDAALRRCLSAPLQAAANMLRAHGEHEPLSVLLEDSARA